MKKKWIVWIIVAALVLAVGAVLIRYGDDIRIFIKAATTDPEQLRKQMESEIEERDKKLQEIGVDVTMPTLNDFDDWLNGKTTTEPPTTTEPVTNPPVIDPPTTTEPTTEPPVTNPPVTNPPVTNPPVTNPPTTEPPVTNPPVTNPPTTYPPVTNPPVTNPPVTNPPVTDPPVEPVIEPVTDAPVTNPPATDPPVTEPPETTVDSDIAPFDPPDTLAPDVGTTEKEIVNACTQRLLELESELFERLGHMKQKAIDEWNALPAGERTDSKKLRIMYDGLGDCYVLEAHCDRQVDAILDLYRGRMREIGGDEKKIDLLWDIYCDEKERAKTYYLGKYLG